MGKLGKIGLGKGPGIGIVKGPGGVGVGRLTESPSGSTWRTASVGSASTQRISHTYGRPSTGQVHHTSTLHVNTNHAVGGAAVGGAATLGAALIHHKAVANKGRSMNKHPNIMASQHRISGPYEPAY